MLILMKKLIVFLLLVVLSILSSVAQDIISDESISDYYINLGEEIEVEFDVNYITDCDSYSVDVDIDYLFKEITITVDYDYDEDCDETDDYDTEQVDILPLLEGDYSVVIECDVSFNFDLDEDIDVGDFEVVKPENKDCDASFVPFISGFCPIYGDEVCACNGQNYDNECEAYFEEEHGLYYHFTCSDFVEENSINFECGIYSLDIDNTFEIYECSNKEFDGDELYFEYEHSGDSVLITFNSSSSGTRLFLVDIDFGDIECLEESDDSKLEIYNYGSGTYYVIADEDGYSWNNSIEICDINTAEDITASNDISIFPNPAKSFIKVKSSSQKIQNIRINNEMGQTVFFSKDYQQERKIQLPDKNGLYFVRVVTALGSTTKKILIE